MSAQAEFYSARANEARTDAASANLDNVRDRCIRAAEAWEAMAARAHRSDVMRERQAAEKAAQVMAEG
jgi:hypothetical protein